MTRGRSLRGRMVRRVGGELERVACAAGLVPLVASSTGSRAAPNAFFSASAVGAAEAEDPSSTSEADDETAMGDE